MLEHLWLIPLLPLLGAASNGIFVSRWPRSAVNAIALGSTGLSFLATLEVAREFANLSADQIPWLRSYFTWIEAGSFRADFALQVDQLTLIMLLVVTGVGWLIHLYSIGYMPDDTGYRRFFAYLNLFMFFMLTLVLAANYLVLFVGWEGVGLCSYLLIGFWFLKKTATDAGNKAFWVNRIGDFGFLLGLFLLFRQFGTLDFAPIFRNSAALPVETSGHGVLTAIALLLLAGATGKSAQLPLYVWLPDAMEGPTPVSALIHAATMVAAGVYMVARSHVLFTHAPVAMFAVAVIGCATALFAATIALVQTDIKRTLAYSTISQLGYMFIACGVGAFGAGIFHLMTHAFFKALLFLGAGSVMHATGGEQDMRLMGGLRKSVPWTYATMFIATLAISGTPGFSGFFSKEEILLAAGTGPYANSVIYVLGVITAGLTALYMFRLLFLTFHGVPRFDQKKTHVHESPRIILAPLAVLALLSVVGGWWAAPHLVGGLNYFDNFLKLVFLASETSSSTDSYSGNSQLIATVFGPPMVAAFIGFLLAWLLYIRRPETPKRLAESLSAPYRLLAGKYFVDELYALLIVRPLVWISANFLWRAVDEESIDGLVNGVAREAGEIGDRLRHLNSGNMRTYAAWVILGAVVLTTLLVWTVR
ncbi:MAG: NADH-quinone oxidoreductase subunit L [Acidobacteria bacterium]|nr:MAG: NADH-quinone oxidoreductase subunit L [Acidobacteriota bacterium]